MKRWIILLPWLVVGVWTVPSVAGVPVKQISSSQGQGQEELVTVDVGPGPGTNVNFIPTQESIEKVWLDDPSRIVIDCDRATADGGRTATICPPGSTVVHLRLIKPIAFESLLTQPDRTLLTVVTQNKNQERKLYQFQINYIKNVPQYHTLSIVPDPPTPLVAGKVRARQVQLENIRLGFEVAKARKFIGQDQQGQVLESRVKAFLVAATDSSVDLNVAARQAGISVDLTNKLAELGEQYRASRRSPFNPNY